MNILRSSPLLLTLLASIPSWSQQVILDPTEYQQAKESGTLPANAVPRTDPVLGNPKPTPSGIERGGGNGGNDCNCWIEPDDSYTLALAPNDDGSSDLISLPFSFNLYGDLYNTCYVNNNGNVSFVQSFGTYSSTGFPNNTNRMVAPFWADVDTRNNGGTVWYKVTPTAMYVNWVGVGYYNQQTDKRNWFQLIITDGTDPVVGVGKNVSFCYKDMQWTTGSASSGVNGFGGTPATVGANRANNTGDYIQFGRFDHAGNDYDGPFGNTDGVSWLDFKNFIFTTVTATQNIPPIATGQYLCDTLRACVGQTAELELTFLAPENNQVTVATSSAPTIGSWTEIANTSGIIASVTGQFTPTDADLGFHEVVFTGVDDGAPNLTSIISMVIEVIPPPSEPPTITGNLIFCAGQSTTLTASGPFSSFLWNNGQTGTSIVVTSPGDYTVTGGIGLCQMDASVTVTQIQAPVLAITGPATYCGDPLPELTASGGFENYQWSNNVSGMTVTVGPGVYTVSGEYEGCINTSAPFTVTEVDPGPPVITGGLQFCEGMNTTLTFNTAAYTSYEWSTGDTEPYLTTTDGEFYVTAHYLNCSYTSEPVTVEEVILPPVVVTGDTTVCSNATVALTASPGFNTYTWSNNNLGPTANVGSGSYYVTARIGPCSTRSNTVTVTALPAPTPVISGPAMECGGAPVTLETTEPYTSYLWSTESTAASVVVSGGVYTVTVTQENGCTGTSPAYTVVLGSDPHAAFSTDPVSPQPLSTTVGFTDLSEGNGSTIVAWAWNFGMPGEDSNFPSPTYTFEGPGRYPVTLTITNADGCQHTVSAIYHIRPDPVIIPNVFTPNGDGKNDRFVIENGQYYDNTLSVFNRWGQEVYATKNYRNTWNAIDIPDGTYYYVFVTNEDSMEYTGHVTILR
ncbi:MAG: gliding motility-associated C-terminal domain-containing protein [Flavobacteriales bacterium]|nr:gliding motility-associated C-terminal domain-containing protein [Flavobacteriales bacterium]